MIDRVTFDDYLNRWRAYDRYDYFTYEGHMALFEYLEQYEEDSGEQIELDIIAIDSDFVEYENLEAFHKDYDKEDYPDLETLSDHTQVIEIPNTDGFIIQNF